MNTFMSKVKYCSNPVTIFFNLKIIENTQHGTIMLWLIFVVRIILRQQHFTHFTRFITRYVNANRH